MKVLAKQTVNIVDETGIVDDDLQLRVFKNNDNEYEVRAFYFGRYIKSDYFSAYETDLESAISTMIAEADWHERNPDYIGDADKFDICST